MIYFIFTDALKCITEVAQPVVCTVTDTDHDPDKAMWGHGVQLYDQIHSRSRLVQRRPAPLVAIMPQDV